MLQLFSDLSQFIDKSPLLLQFVILLLALGSIAFIVCFVLPWSLVLRPRLKALIKDVRALHGKREANINAIKITDQSLRYLRDQYAHTLHTPTEARHPAGATIGLTKATIPAESVFNSQTVFEGRLRTEFFKHLPGLLTGLGIIPHSPSNPLISLS